MPTEIANRQIKAFGDSVMAMHREADHACHVDEIAIVGASVAQSIVRVVENRQGKPEGLAPEELESWKEVCRGLLRAMTGGQRMIDEVERLGHQVKWAEEFAGATLEVRELLASLLSVGAESWRVRPPSYDELTAAAVSHPPPQSWYEEDVRGLDGKSQG